MKHALALSFFTLALPGLNASGAHAQIAEYTFEGSGTTTAAPNAAATYTSLGSAFYNAPDGTGAFGSGTFTGEESKSNTPGLATAFADNGYVTFTVTPNAGFALNVTGLSGTTASQNSSRSYYVESSATGFGADASHVLAAFSGGFGDNFTVGLSGLTGLTTATEFRVYIDETGYYEDRGFRSSGVGGSQPLTLLGTVDATTAAAPEPSPLAALSIGLLGLGGLLLKARRSAA